MNIVSGVTCLVAVAVLVGVTGTPEQQVDTEQHDVYESRMDIQVRYRACRKGLGGKCVNRKKDCPERYPLVTKPGRPYCNKRRRCCYPAPITTEVAATEAPPMCRPPTFWIVAGTRYGCPCSYYGAIHTGIAWPGGQCCQPSNCPNPNFKNLHVCGRDDGQTCRNSADAFEFAKQAWTKPVEIYPVVFSCQDIAYTTVEAAFCQMDGYVQSWFCNINDEGDVTSCSDAGDCQVESFLDDGTLIIDSYNCR